MSDSRLYGRVLSVVNSPWTITIVGGVIVSALLYVFQPILFGAGTSPVAVSASTGPRPESKVVANIWPVQLPGVFILSGWDVYNFLRRELAAKLEKEETLNTTEANEVARKRLSQVWELEPLRELLEISGSRAWGRIEIHNHGDGTDRNVAIFVPSLLKVNDLQSSDKNIKIEREQILIGILRPGDKLLFTVWLGKYPTKSEHVRASSDFGKINVDIFP